MRLIVLVVVMLATAPARADDDAAIEAARVWYTTMLAEPTDDSAAAERIAPISVIVNAWDR